LSWRFPASCRKPESLAHRAVLLLALAGTMLGPAGPAATQPAITEAPRRILFGSCLDPSRPHPILETIVEQRPELFLFLGDNIYADTRNPAVMRAKYRKLAGSAGFRRLSAACPILATWDDHDFGANDAGADFPMKEESRRQFLDFWNAPADSPRRSHPGVYDAQRFGPPERRVQVILLDLRYFRSPLRWGRLPGKSRSSYLPDDRPRATLLGEEQWRWLEERLREPARLRLIVSSIQMLAEYHGWEAWANFPRELARLLELLKTTRAEGVLFLSGDRHFAEISRRDEPGLYPLYDITTSGLNRRFPREAPNPNRFRVDGYYLKENFGLLEIDWADPEPRVRVRILDAEARMPLDLEIRLEKLRFPISQKGSSPPAYFPKGHA
jgi:alkaline phosphatase D